MPFLLPAVTAAICDIGILYLHHVTYYGHVHAHGSGDGDNSNSHFDDTTTSTPTSTDSRRIYQGSFILPFATMRLFLLVVPYPYHALKGKALRCPLLYRAFYAITFIILFFYSLSLLLIDPKSLETLIPSSSSSSSKTTSSINNGGQTAETATATAAAPASHDQITRYLWWSIIFTFGATLSHVVLFYHVRSTAPSDDDLFPSKNSTRRQPKVLLYYAKKKNRNDNSKNRSSSFYHDQRGSLLHDGNPQQRAEVDDDEDLTDHDFDTENDYWSDDDNDNENEEERSGLLANDKRKDSSFDPKGATTKRKKRRNKRSRTISNQGNNTNHSPTLMTIESSSVRSGIHNPMHEISSKILNDIQVSLEKTKLEWTKKLEEYQFRSVGVVGRGMIGGTNGDGSGGAGGAGAGAGGSGNVQGVGIVAGTTGTQDSPSAMMMIQKVPPTPFRVVLELFAGEDVLSNGRLETVYDADDGTALMFFIPQLLSFLLHGALDSSSQLEGWILDKCQKNIFFAHKCYWFLRAWALESTNLTCSNTGGPPTPAMRLRKSSSLASFEAGVDELFEGSNTSLTATAPKLLPEEYAVIEDLMRRIMECGEEPARLVHFGPMINNASISLGHSEGSDGNGNGNGNTGSQASEEETPSPSALMTVVESGAIPIDPNSGFPSAKHFEFLAASERYGFLPMGKNSLTTNLAPLIQGNKDRSYFDATPVFLDALLTIADGLFKVPRELRSGQFRKQLNLLEVEALPSNDIYIPLQDPHHRVWRIVSDESIAISTKERVPCIICLEVVDYPPGEIPTRRDVRKMLEKRMESDRSSATDRKRPITSERETISKWFFNQRDPHRRETALEKLTNSIGHRLIKMPGKFNTSMRTSIEKLKTTNKELQDLLTIKVPENFSMDDDELDHGYIPSHLHTHEPMPVIDIERGEEKADLGSKPVTVDSRSYHSLPAHRPPGIHGPSSPRNSRSSNGAMGQWASPAGRSNSDDAIVKYADVEIEDLAPPSLKRRSYQSVGTRTSSKGSLIERNSQTSLRRRTSDLEIDVDDEECNGDSNAKKNSGAAGTPSKPPTKPPPVIFKESWMEKEDRIRAKSAIGDLPGWRLLPVLIKSNDDLRQEQLASQLIFRIALILARERIPVWLCPYEILALESHGGIIEAIPDTISIASLKKNDPNFTDLKGFFHDFFDTSDDLSDAKANFVESLAAYSIVCFLLQIKDRHNGNILLDNRGHLIHIDFGFFFLSSPGKNTGFESAPFKLTREWVDLLGGADSHLFAVFRTLCYRSFLALRKHCHEIILLVEMLKLGNEDLKCFRGRPDDAISELRQRFRLDLNDRACFEYVNSLVDTSLENW
eukprot:CAMPEP_0113522030 /NCGR_PEP_ID=MMETSP0014_2-20120614/44970_1 /TAXON_ID=2857 /ORGANISM="Nitzschia sp." /LENGTH=1341 /DNA_ID=CAMNT_0000420057 /DNA_START=35 /DNA_END=4057 /DNA_ORIENTATION=- /assembly_acc=CAM_ASM_000159